MAREIVGHFMVFHEGECRYCGRLVFDTDGECSRAYFEVLELIDFMQLGPNNRQEDQQWREVVPSEWPKLLSIYARHTLGIHKTIRSIVEEQWQ